MRFIRKLNIALLLGHPIVVFDYFIYSLYTVVVCCRFWRKSFTMSKSSVSKKGLLHHSINNISIFTC